MANKWNIKIGTIVDTSTIQKQLDKKKVYIDTVLNIKINQNDIAKITKDIKSKLNFNNLTLNNSDILKALNQIQDRADSSSKSIKNVFKETTNSIKLVNRLATEQQKFTKAESMKRWLDNNSKASKSFGNEINSMISKLLSADDVTVPELKKIETQFKNIQLEAREAGLLGRSFGDGFRDQAMKFSQWISVTGLIMSAINQVKKAVTSIRGLDTELIDLKKTSDGTTKQLEEFYFTSNDIAKALGVSTKSIINAASSWSRLGETIKDAKIMAENSAIFESISPDLNIDESTDGLVSTMKAFGIEADDVLDGVISKINIIGNTQAVSNGELVDILTRSSSAMAVANNTLEQTIALGTAATEVTRNAESVGTALKTISMRIRGYDEETEEYIGNVEDLSGAIADLTKTSSTQGGISLFTDDSKTTFKSTYQLLKEISDIWDQLTDKNRAQLLEALAGKRQGQIVAAMISNFGAAEKSMNSMMNSTGNAMQEMNIIYESLDYKVNKLSETGVGIAQNLFGRDDMKTVVDTLSALGQVLDFVTEKLGLFGTLSAGLSITALVKNFDWLDKSYLKINLNF